METLEFSQIIDTSKQERKILFYVRSLTIIYFFLMQSLSLLSSSITVPNISKIRLVSIQSHSEFMVFLINFFILLSFLLSISYRFENLTVKHRMYVFRNRLCPTDVLGVRRSFRRKRSIPGEVHL